MSLLREYLVDGRSCRDLAAEHRVSEALVRATLGEKGLRVDSDSVRDPVCAAVGWLGYGSFSRFVHQRGLSPLNAQAQELGVTKAQLKRVYEIFRRLAEEEGGDDGTGT